MEYMETENTVDILRDARETVLKALPNYIKSPLPNLTEKMKAGMDPLLL